MHTGDANESSLSHDLTGLPAFLTGFLEMSFDAVVVSDAREHITYWNPAAEQMFGWTAQEALGKTPVQLFWQIKTPEEKKNHRQRQLRLKRGETLRGEQMVSRQDGSSLCVQYVLRAALEADGTLAGYLGIYRDIPAQHQDATERQQEEESLRARTEEIETLLKVSPVAIFVAHDPECTHITGNPAGYRLVELPENSGANVSKSAPAQERPTYRTFRNGIEVPAQDLPMQKAARLGIEVDEEELELRFEDGSQKFLYAFAKPLFDAQGRSRGAVAAMLDITERKRVEQQLERSNQWFHRILDSIQDDFYVLDNNWKFVFTSRSFTSKIGKEPKDFVGNNIWEMFPKHVGTSLEENFRAAMEKREIRRFEIHGKYTNAWYRMTVFPSAEGITILGTDITERKHMEEALQASELRYRMVADNTYNFESWIDPEGNYLYASPSCQRIYGRAAEEFLANPALRREMVHPDDRAAFDEHIVQEAAHATGGTEFRILRPDGAVRWIGHVCQPVFDQAGTYLGIRASNRDITNRKQAEEALRESEERLRQMIETSLVAIGFGDSTGKIFGANASFYRLTGYSREEIEARQLGWNHLTAPEYAELDQQMMATLAATGSAGPYEKEYIRKDGSRIPLLLTISKLPGLPGHDEHIAFIMDISESKHREEQLRELSQRLTYHVDNSPLAVIEWGSDMRLIRWSGAAERIFGWKAEEVLGKRMEDLRWIYEEDTSQVSDVSVDLQTGTDPQRFSANRNYRKDGSIAYCEWYNSSLLDESGKLRSILSLVLDVTKRKHAEDALREHQKQLQLLNETLEQKVQDKTEEVRRLASDLVQAVQHERHRISHILHDDLQQRIYAIQMQLTFLHDEFQKENETARREVSEIEKQLAEILQVTRHLSIDLSPPILRDEGLSHAIHWLAAQMRQRYGLDIEIRANGDFTIINEALHVLLFNCVRELLFNVVKHAQASQAVVTLQWADDDLQVEVRDNGRGFPGDMSKQQGSEEIRVEALRSGFGLSTIRYQLSLFGGRLEIHSEPGAGARIRLIVPITEEASEA